jgi:transcriptional regulator GlxA family with amidase domain
LQQAKELLHDRFQSPLHLSEIADSLSVHPAHLSKAFRLHFHTTPGEYLRELRVKHAASLLHTDMSLAGIAVASGFCDQSHLTRAFMRHFGVSPARYRADLSRSINGFMRVPNAATGAHPQS